MGTFESLPGSVISNSLSTAEMYFQHMAVTRLRLIRFFVSSNNRAEATSPTAWRLECNFGIHTWLVFWEGWSEDLETMNDAQRVYVYLVNAIF